MSFAIKSSFRRLRSYAFLLAMISVGITAVTFVQSVTLGMSLNVIEGASRYLGGRYIVVSRALSIQSENYISDPPALVKALESEGMVPSLVVQRETVVNGQPTLYFNGESFVVRRIWGVDFDVEAPIFESLMFDSGGYSGVTGTNGILISREVAQRFKVRVGDAVNLRLYNREGYLDSADLVIAGIFKDASIFGFYTCYMDRELLRRLAGDPETGCSAMGFYFGDTTNPRETAKAAEQALQKAGFSLFPRLANRRDFDAILDETWQGERIALLPVENYIDSKVMDLIHAVEFVSYLFLALILLIILVGMRNTTQIMTRRRIKEIGTIRALGMSRTGAMALVSGEAVLVASFGFLLGVASASAALVILQAVPLSWPEGFDIFLRNGHLGWSISPLFIGINYVALLAMTVLGALPAAMRAANIPPSAAIASHE